jgi:hypothetical protein
MPVPRCRQNRGRTTFKDAKRAVDSAKAAGRRGRQRCAAPGPQANCGRLLIPVCLWEGPEAGSRGDAPALRRAPEELVGQALVLSVDADEARVYRTVPAAAGEEAIGPGVKRRSTQLVRTIRRSPEGCRKAAVGVRSDTPGWSEKNIAPWQAGA